jgi:hypothetical protein
MQTRLGHPTSDDDLYLGLEDDVDPYRPVMPGDVFRVKIRAVEVDHELAMLVAHPCNMRKGPHLRRSLPMIPVVPYRRVPFDEWPNGHFRVFPLPNLVAGAEYAASFDEIGMVLSERLTPEARVACLSENGILLLQQRRVFADTRAIVKLETFERAAHSVLAEAELLEDWNRALVPVREQHEEPLRDALRAEAEAFDFFLGDSSDERSLRAKLRNRTLVPEVRRAVRGEIARRVELGPRGLTGGGPFNGGTGAAS